MRRFLLFMVYTVVFFLQSLCSLAQPARAEDSIAAIMQQHEVMGLSVAVVKKGKLVYTHSFGWKNKELNQPLQEESLFRIASISKSFSATAIMQLVEAKK